MVAVATSVCGFRAGELCMKPTLRNLIVTVVVLQAIMTVSVLYIAWRVKEIYDAIPGEPITVTIEQKKQ
jgi:hypothetical protein